MIYFDTSYLVRLYYEDPGAEKVRALAATDHVACAALGQSEMMAAFHRKLREGAIHSGAYGALVGQIEAHIEAGAFQWIAQDGAILLRVPRLQDPTRIRLSARSRCNPFGDGSRSRLPVRLFE